MDQQDLFRPTHDKVTARIQGTLVHGLELRLPGVVEDAVPAPAITMALYERFRSRLDDTFADKMLAMMRNQFGGHAVRTTRP